MSSSGPSEWAVVVGAAGAIGSRIATRLTDRGLGCVLVGRSLEPLRQVAAGRPGTVVCPADIQTEAAVAAIAEAITGPVRVAINAAAAPMGESVLEVDPGVVLAAVDVKVNGTLRLVRAVRDHLVADSRIVILGGNLGYDPIPEAPTAGVGNAAVANLVRQLSVALGATGATCHVVAPGPVWTERLRALLGEAAKARGVSEAVVVAEFRDRSPIGHLVTVDEVVWAVEMLLAPEARSLAGGTLLLDAGQRTAIP